MHLFGGRHSKNQAEALGVAKGVYECQTQGEVLGIQGVLADSTARAELPHFVKVFKLAKQAHIQPDLHIFYLDWDYYPSLRRGEQVSNYPALKDQWKELGFPPENLHDLSEDTQERKEFYEMFNGQAAALDDARFPNILCIVDSKSGSGIINVKGLHITQSLLTKIVRRA